MSVKEFNIRKLDINDPNDLHMYEKALYLAFSSNRKITNDIVRNIDHIMRRSTTKIPYLSQTIYVAQIGKRIVAAIAINTDLKLLQLELRGFIVDKTSDTCEVLHLFNNYDALGFDILHKLGSKILDSAKDCGINRIYGTCIEKRLRPYMHLGFVVKDTNHMNNEKRFLIECNVNENAIG